MIIDGLIQTAARAKECLDAEDRRATVAFIKSRWNLDGGVCGRENECDLCYTAFAAMGMRALNGRVPRLRLWHYLRSFRDGASLDLVHLFCLVRLRTIYPMTRKRRQKLMDTLKAKGADSATDMFFKVIMAEYLHEEDRPDAQLIVLPSENTSDIAASVVINNGPDQTARELLMNRRCETGGFFPTSDQQFPTLEATAKALFALRVLNVDLAPVRASSLDFIESLRREDGGYAGHDGDEVTDVKNTFFALLSIGCLMGH